MRRIGKIVFFAGALSLVGSAGLQAQDTNEFQRIAKRIMDAYDVGDELEHKPDSSHVYGGAYLGASSNGRAMPSGYVTYLKDNLLLTSQLSVDFSELNTEKDVSTDFKSGADRLTSSNILTKYEKQDFSTRLDIPLYYRLGQQQENGYRGDALYHRIRYQIGNSRHFQAGLRVEKDAGERYYDSYGAYAMLHDVGILDRAVVGDYRIGFGEGLVLGGNIWNSKNTPSLKMQGGIRPMTGMDEVNFLRGAAITLSLNKHISLSAFGSYRKRDATLTNNGEVQTLLATGYHRTASEWERKRNVGSAVIGGNIEWLCKGFHLGATGYWQKFSRTLNPGTQQYRAIYPKGSSFGVIGLNYGYTRYRLSFGGEAAYSTAGNGFSTINRASWNIGRNYILSAVQRFYAYQYYSFYASSLAENSNAQNESGVLVHLQAEPLAGLQLIAYADFFHHPWPRYRMSHSSTGQGFPGGSFHQFAFF